MPGPAFLTGERISLHTVEESDLEFLQAGVNDPAVREYLTLRRPVNRADEREFLEAQVQGDDQIHLLVVGADGPAGTVGLGPIEADAGRAEIGIWLQEKDWGRGYGREASRLLVTHGFEALRLHRIEAQVLAGNEASRALWESLGFEHEAVHREAAYLQGEYVDVHRYAVLETEWAA